MRGVADVVSKSAPFSNDSPRLGGFGAVLRPKLVVAPIPPAGSGVLGAASFAPPAVAAAYWREPTASHASYSAVRAASSAAGSTRGTGAA